MNIFFIDSALLSVDDVIPMFMKKLHRIRVAL